jgi:type I restriction-modification system DNA methylase subunit
MPHDLTGNKKHSAIFTPMDVAQTMAEYAKPTPDMKILDPTCGSGNLLVACAEYMLAQGFQPEAIAACLFGCDIQEDYVRQCRERLKLLLGDLPIIDQNIGLYNFLNFPVNT